MKELKRMLLSKSIGKNSYWSLNKQLVRTLGLESALILQHIIDLQEVFKKNEIFQSQPNMAEELGITEYAVKNKIVELSKGGYINIVKKGVPCKNYYSTNDEKIIEILVTELDGTKSTDLLGDSIDVVEVNGLVDTESTDLLVSNQPTSPTEIVSTITKNTIKNTTKNTDEAELTYTPQLIDNMITKFVDKISNRTQLHFFMSEVEEDYGGWDNLLKLRFGNDTGVINNYNNKLNEYKNGTFAK
jgi:biotin operon repressor